jgi:small subunit ribosomal protein S4
MSRPEARQLVNHAHFTVNGKKVNIPSYLCKAGDVIAIKADSMSSEKFKLTLEANASRPALNWLSVDRTKGQANVVSLPDRSEIDLVVEENRIVELYSK